MNNFLSVYKNEICIADRIENGNTFFRRFIGLMGRKYLMANQGLYLKPCRSIHTFQMRFPIDVLFLSEEGVVLDMIRNMRPWKLKTASKATVSTLELSANSIEKYSIAEGDKLIIKR